MKGKLGDWEHMGSPAGMLTRQKSKAEVEKFRFLTLEFKRAGTF